MTLRQFLSQFSSRVVENLMKELFYYRPDDMVHRIKPHRTELSSELIHDISTILIEKEVDSALRYIERNIIQGINAPTESTNQEEEQIDMPTTHTRYKAFYQLTNNEREELGLTSDPECVGGRYTDMEQAVLALSFKVKEYYPINAVPTELHSLLLNLAGKSTSFEAAWHDTIELIAKEKIAHRNKK
jgi:hypothetical protein